MALCFGMTHLRTESWPACMQPCYDNCYSLYLHMQFIAIHIQNISKLQNPSKSKRCPNLCLQKNDPKSAPKWFHHRHCCEFATPAFPGWPPRHAPGSPHPPRPWAKLKRRQGNGRWTPGGLPNSWGELGSNCGISVHTANIDMIWYVTFFKHDLGIPGRFFD